MIDIKLTVMELASSIIIVRCALITQLVEAIDILDGQRFQCIPRDSKLCTLLIKLFSVQTVGCSTH